MSDNDVLLSAALWRTMADLMGMALHFTVPYRPQADGLAERAMRDTKEAIRAVAMTQRVGWIQTLPLVAFALNTGECATTGFSPDVHIFGRPLRSPLQVMVSNTSHRELTDLDDAGFRDQVAAARTLRSQLKSLGVRMLKGAPPQFRVGDRVKLLRRSAPPLRGGGPKTVTPPWIGPLKVLAVTPHNLTLEILEGAVKTERMVNVADVAPWREDEELHPPGDRPGPEEDGRYKVEALLDVRGKPRDRRKPGSRDTRRFLVKWEGWPVGEATWEPVENLSGDEKVEELAKAFYRRIGKPSVLLSS